MTLVDGLISDCAKIVTDRKDQEGWFDVSTLKEPYRIEGKKTMGLELAEQLGWDVPDVILYPTGGGTGLIGMWKAFAELEAIGFLGKKRPRMVAVQASGCAPMVRAYEAGEEHAPRWPTLKASIGGFGETNVKVENGARLTPPFSAIVVTHAIGRGTTTPVISL